MRVVRKTPTAGSPATGKSVAGIINLFVDDLVGKGGNETEEGVFTRVRKHFQVRSEDWNDVTFTGQRIRWTQDSPNGPYIDVSQCKAIDELHEIPVERNTKEDSHFDFQRTQRTEACRDRNWLQSRRQFQCCDRISRRAAMAASPTFGHVQSLHKLARQIESQPVKFQCWPLTGPLRILGFLDASYRNNDDGSSKRGMTVFLAESRERSSKDGMSCGSLIDHERN